MIPHSHFSRRKFIQAGALSTLALASGAVLSNRKAIAQTTVSGAAHYRIPLNTNWKFFGKHEPYAFATPAFTDAAASTVTLPHCVSKLSWQGWHPSEWQGLWTYRRHFATPPTFKNRRIFLDFEGVMNSATPMINGHQLPPRLGGYQPFQYEITNFVQDGGNDLTVVVDSRWNQVPPEGSPKGSTSVDYLEPGGIVRSVSLRAVPQVFISDVFAKPVKVVDPGRAIEIQCTIDAADASVKSLQVKVELRDGEKTTVEVTQDLVLEKTGETTVALTLSGLGNVKLWDVDSPQLYQIVTTLIADGKPVHDYTVRTGLRDASFTKDGFFLNGRQLRFFGLNRHEIYPYTGFAMPARVMRRDAEILRHEFNVNMVRCSHYPQTEAFLDACDELGLMVWEEPPGWQFVGDDAWKELVVRDVSEMVRRDRNRPSVVIWGTRVNESHNDPALYERTRALANSLDGSRPTSGSMTVHSTKDWHQEVFAMDDYHSAADGSAAVDPPLPGVPYMLAESVGQFSYAQKKSFNNRYRRAGDLALQTSQAVYHAQVHNRAGNYPNFCGVIAWCAFDYASQINSFNEIKCPGVADVFRIPKLGASFYQAQVSPKVKAVIQPNFYWDFGSRTPNGPGKNSAIFSNCEKLEIFVDGKSVAKVEPDRATYPHLAYPPFFCDLEIAKPNQKQDLRIDGYVDGKVALSRSFSAETGKDTFSLATDDPELVGDGIDATRLVFKVADRFGYERAFGGGEVVFDISGPGEIVGDNPFGLLDDSGGVGAVWIRSLTGNSGQIKVTAIHSTLGSKSATINVTAASNEAEV